MPTREIIHWTSFFVDSPTDSPFMPALQH